MQDRYQQLKYICGDPYPRLKVNKNTLTLPEFRSRYSELANNDTVETTVSVSGRLFWPCSNALVLRLVR
jgi:lysyl-tRNA synthetase class 2